MSKILDREVKRRKPAKGPHREIVGAAVMNSKLLCKIIQRKKAVGGIESLLVLPMAALYFAVKAWGIGTNELELDTKLCGGGLKQ